MFWEDLDGAYILDYLSQSALKGYRLLSLPEVQIYKIIKEGFRFVSEDYKAKQEEALGEVCKSHIARKLALLWSYWNQRIDLLLSPQETMNYHAKHDKRLFDRCHQTITI